MEATVRHFHFIIGNFQISPPVHVGNQPTVDLNASSGLFDSTYTGGNVASLTEVTWYLWVSLYINLYYELKVKKMLQ